MSIVSGIIIGKRDWSVYYSILDIEDSYWEYGFIKGLGSEYL